jgi:cytochrome c-type biogenesis protein CcmH/NrfG
MKARTLFRTLTRAALAASILVFAACSRDDGWLNRLINLESLKGTRPDLNTIDGLKKAIEQNKAEVEKKVSANQNLGVYYKMLALKYIDNEMYGLALDALTQAIKIFPENEQLFYYAAISSARMAKADVTDQKAIDAGLATAEVYYKRAIFLDPTYVNAMYGLAVLYAEEMGRPEDAEPLLKQILEREPRNFDALFLIARVEYQLARPEQAIDYYNRIIDSKPPASFQKQAESNKLQIQEELYGQTK